MSKPVVNSEHTSVRLPLELAKALDLIAEHAGASRSQVIRLAADQFVTRVLETEG